MRDEVSAQLKIIALHYGYEGRGWCPIVGESGPDPQTGMKGKRLLWSDSTVLQACVLGFTLQGLKFGSNCSASHGY